MSSDSDNLEIMSSDLDDMEIYEGTLLRDRYEVKGFLRQGGFGVVAKCLDTITDQVVAIKVNKSDPEILQQAKMEIFVLEQLRASDIDRSNIVEWNGFFQDGNRICLNYELLDQSLSQYIWSQNTPGLPISELRPVLYQLANALYHLGNQGIVHADIKPENIMVVDRNESPIKVKLIDFGLAIPASGVLPGDCVGTVGYMAPEVMLGIPFTEAADMWSLGLVAVELATGVKLYPGNSPYDVLKMITETQGQLPDHILDTAMYNNLYFNKDKCNKQHWILKSEDPAEDEIDDKYRRTRHLKLSCLDVLEQVLKDRRGPESGQHLLVNLIKQMLALDANQRITAPEVLRHPFFNPVHSESSPCTDKSSTGKQNPVVSQQEHVNTSANSSSSEDDLEIFEGTLLGDRYEVEGFLGQGGFGVVTKCHDRITDQVVAIKVNESNIGILQQAKMEIFVLEQLRASDIDRSNIVEWNGFFQDGNRICLNFELLDQNLSQYIRSQNTPGLPISELRPVLYQLANALYHLGNQGIVHADIKPENIMVVDRNESPIKVKLIDFGLAIPASGVLPGDCGGTVGYMAPEVMLGFVFNEAADMWSLGLVAVELATGVKLYPGNSEYEILKMIIETQGQLPDHVLDSAVHNDYYFKKDCNRQHWSLRSEDPDEDKIDYAYRRTRHLKLSCLDDLKQVLKDRRGPESGQHLLVNLVKHMLALDPNQRITVTEILLHPFFNPGLH